MKNLWNKKKVRISTKNTKYTTSFNHWFVLIFCIFNFKEKGSYSKWGWSAQEWRWKHYFWIENYKKIVSNWVGWMFKLYYLMLYLLFYFIWIWNQFVLSFSDYFLKSESVCSEFLWLIIHVFWIFLWLTSNFFNFWINLWIFQNIFPDYMKKIMMF